MTRRGISLFLSDFLITFGVLSGLLQIFLTIWPQGVNRGLLILATAVLISSIFSLVRSVPSSHWEHPLKNPSTKIIIKTGDLFSEDSQLVIGFTDTFDTDLRDNRVISASSIQGQFQQKYYGDRLSDLDRDLEIALMGENPIASERREDKVFGKLDRYDIGAVATLEVQERRFFCLAYGRMKNDLVVRSSIDDIWISLSNLWKAVRVHGRFDALAMPVIGSDMARVGALSRESLVKLIVLSFVAHSRHAAISRSLTIVIHPNDLAHFNVLEIQAFVRSI